MAACFEEIVCVDCDNAGLVRLRYVGKDGVHHAHQHAVLANEIFEHLK